MGLFAKKKENNINFNEIIEDTIYDLKNNPKACTFITESNPGEKLKNFIRYFGTSDLLDKEYMENEKLIQEKDINNLTYKEIGTMLTAIIRGDRFCSGLIYSKVKDGTLLRLLERFKDIKSKGEE